MYLKLYFIIIRSNFRTRIAEYYKYLEFLCFSTLFELIYIICTYVTKFIYVYIYIFLFYKYYIFQLLLLLSIIMLFILINYSVNVLNFLFIKPNIKNSIA